METSEEMEGKAYVHYQAWQEAYADFLPQEFLVNRTLENCQKIAHTYPDNTLIALVDGQVVGFACYGKSSSEDLPQTGELYALYVLKEHYGRGIGYALMQAALEKLQSYDQIFLWVFEGNSRAIDFYEQVGFAFDGMTKTVNLGKACLEQRMVLKMKKATKILKYDPSRHLTKNLENATINLSSTWRSEDMNNN